MNLSKPTDPRLFFVMVIPGSVFQYKQKYERHTIFAIFNELLICSPSDWSEGESAISVKGVYHVFDNPKVNLHIVKEEKSVLFIRNCEYPSKPSAGQYKNIAMKWKRQQQNKLFEAL